MSVAGEIDLYTAPRLHGELATALAGGVAVQILVDMSGVEFCDSTGMNVLLAAQRTAVKKVLQLTGLESVFTVLDDTATMAGS